MIDATTKDKRKMLCIKCDSDSLLPKRIGGTATVTCNNCNEFYEEEYLSYYQKHKVIERESKLKDKHD